MLSVEVQPSQSMERHPEQQHRGHQRVAGDEPGEGRHNGETDQGDTNAVEGAEHAQSLPV